MTVDPDRAAFEVFTDEAGEVRWRLLARNGEIVAVSEGYTTKAAALDTVALVRILAPEAEVEDLT